MIEAQKNLLLIIPGFLNIETYQKLLYHQDFPLGTIQISSYLRETSKIQSDIIDLRLEEEVSIGLSSENFNLASFKKAFISILERDNIQEYNNVGINCYTSFQFAQTELISQILNENFPKLKIIVGGYHPSAMEKDFLYKDAPYDYIIKGEAELLLNDLLTSNLTKKTPDKLPKIFVNQNPVDINALSFPDYSYFINKYPISKAFRLDLYTSRGCPYQCAFCADNYSFRTFTRNSFKNYMKQLTSLVDSYNIENPKIGFADQSFNRIPIINKILDYLHENNFREDYTISSQCRIETIHEDPKLVKRIIECGIIIGYGFESANKNLLVEMHKTSVPSKYLEDTINIIKIYKDQNETYCRLNILAGFPGETKESFDETVDFINQYAIDENIQISPSLFSNYPNVFVYKNMEYYEKKYGTEFIPNWWKLNSNLFKHSIPNKPSSKYFLRDLISDYKDKYISILKHFKHDTFANLVVWKQFFNNWYKELN